MLTKWIKKYDDLYWGPLGFTITIDVWYGKNKYIVHLGGQPVQYTGELRAAKQYVQSFIDEACEIKKIQMKSRKK